MTVSCLAQSPLDCSADWLVVGVFDGEEGTPAALRGHSLGELLRQLRAGKDLASSPGETTPILGGCGVSARAVLAAGLGPRSRFGPGEAYAVGVTIARRLASRPRSRVAILLPEAAPVDQIVSALVEGLVVGSRGTDLRKSEPVRHVIGEWVLLPSGGPEVDVAVVSAAIERGQVVGAAVNLARQLGNTPPSDKPPVRLAAEARAQLEPLGVQVETWDRPRIEAERFGGLLGVAAGSDQDPAFVVLRLRRGGESAPLALVGKGVTFDSGGLSLKPTDSMKDMKADMTGAAVVLATFRAAAQLQLPVNLDGYLALSENMTGGRAMKLGDVLRIRNGRTVEVLNTDAEGRLLLADALSYAVEQKPARVLDLATLTGACLVALGSRIAGLFSNDDAFAADVLAACRSAGERAWRLPLDDDFEEALKSPIADLKNVGGKWGGAITAAKFLQRFVDGTPWVHLDIAGPSWVDTESGAADAGATGCFVRTLVRLLEGHERGEA